jgi:hypothetical protein
MVPFANPATRSSHLDPRSPLPWIKSRVATARDDGRKRRGGGTLKNLTRNS